MKKARILEKYCNYCDQTTKMVLVNNIEGDNEKAWYRCPKCHHLALLNVINETEKNTIQEKIQKSEYKLYKPDITFSIGEIIYHDAFDDYGKVIKKDTTSDGNRAIIVKFEKLGERKLLEDFKQNIQSEDNMINNTQIINLNENREEVN